ncbi:IS630 family transposase [uncultured Desulfosarcina sp.]|uniref:IS630 family transposase n=1 Tax=uncultured Desulfosarcina sp. TaxID=218289 RepID=UPI0029C880CD|nr:IS630 family transposase [uncultured Desulfosarcina sp.]
MTNLFNESQEKRQLSYPELHELEGCAEFQRIKAQNRYLLIKEYQQLLDKESQRHGARFRKVPFLKKFCQDNGVNWKTFYSYLRNYKKNGVFSLAPKSGHWKGNGFFDNIDIESIRLYIDPNRGYAYNYRILSTVFRRDGAHFPGYSSFRRAAISHRWIQPRAKGVDGATIEKEVNGIQKHKRNPNLRPEIPPPCEINIPEWFRVINKKAFNLAFYNYATVYPFLDPSLKLKKKKQLIEEITSRTHHPLPGVSLNITQSTLYHRIAGVKKHGFEYLIPKRSILRTRKYGNKIAAKIEIDLNNPLSWLTEIKAILNSIGPLYPLKQRSALQFIDYMISLYKIPKTKSVKFYPKLTDDEVRILENAKSGTHRLEREKATSLLMANNGNSMLEICTVVNRPSKTIYGWLRKYREKGISIIATKKDFSRSHPELKKRTGRIVKIIHHQPKDYDINRTSWRLDDIAKVYESIYGKKLHRSSVLRAIKETDYTWKRARYVLMCNDPKYKIKVKKVLETLRNMGPGEAFFFVDEAGPWQVKKYGGTSLTEKGTVKIVPQIQKPKGRVTFIGALDALKNQVIFFFRKSKDTETVKRLILILYYKYHGCSKLHITWDCASWHRSKELKNFIESLNSRKTGPEINSLLLPKRCQYLNVIESVFSGLKKAVIFNSDYGSECEMKTAISKHFYERNRYFKENPKRVGKKIWNPEYFNIDDFESGLHKKI